MKLFFFAVMLTAGMTTKSLAQDQTVNGDLYIGAGNHDQLGYGKRLNFIGNSDNCFITQYNVSPNITEFRFNMGDDLFDDKFVIGVTNSVDGQWYSMMVVNGDGRVGIGRNPSDKLDVDITSNTEQKRVSVFTNTGVNAINAPIGGLRFNWYGSNNAEIQMVRGFHGGDGAGLSFHTSGDGGTAVERMRLDRNGNLGIGVTDPQAKLAVNGLIRSREVKVETANFPDYVFKPTYRLQSLSTVKAYIDKNHHLPDVPSEAEAVKEGINLGEMNKLLLKKVEELTLHLIKQDRLLKKQQNENIVQNRQLGTLRRILLTKK